ncbi:MAG TPA: single-stranded DNA-binding protein [Ktedonobacterales bacterium]|nr:single-stranded DNA-binding protein [Ktedonobacterales bacterium]
MAVELHRYLSDLLEGLPAHHPDRRYLEGLQETNAGYLDQTRLPDDPDRTAVSAPPARSAAADPGAIDHIEPPAENAAAAAPEPPSTPEQERVHLHGRVGQPPRFRTTPKGTRIGSFPLAVRGDDDSTVWWQVLAFNGPHRPLADRLAQLNLAKGQAAEVVGFDHTRERSGRDGQPRVERQVYAVAIKAR